MHIVIVGAGIVGVTAAHRLLDQGHQVTLIDRGEPTAPHRGNAGIIAHTDILPLASPRMIMQAVKWLIDPVGPFAVRPAYLPRLMPWLARFLFAALPSRIERSIEGIAQIQAMALPAWERLLTHLSMPGELNHHGILYVFENIETFERNKPQYQRQLELSIRLELLDGAVLRSMEPALSERFQRAAFYPDVAHVNDPLVLTQKLALAAADRGAHFEQARVSGVAIANGDEPVVVLEGGRSISADRLIIAAGAWSKPLAAALGDAVPLDTERGYNATMTEPGVSLTRPVLFDEHAFIITPLQTGLRVGGAVELASTSATPNWQRVEALMTKARMFVPELKDGGRTDWMGCRPSLPDTLPVISRSRWSPKVIYAFGHSHHGLTQSAATAELVGALIADQPPAIDLSHYSAQRF